MSEIIHIHEKHDPAQDEPGRINKIASIGAGIRGVMAETLVRNRNRSTELTQEQRRRFGRYVGNLALVAGNFYHPDEMYSNMNRVADGLDREGLLHPNKPLGVRVLWRKKSPDVDGGGSNQQLMKTAEVLREVLHLRGIKPYVSSRPEYPYGNEGSEQSRALEALNRSARGFEELAGFGGIRSEPPVGELGFVAVISSAWARAFRGVDARQLLINDGFVLLNGAGDKVEDVRWIAPSVREKMLHSHD